MKHLVLPPESWSDVEEGTVDLIFTAPRFSKRHGGDMSERGMSRKEFEHFIEEADRTSKDEAFLFVLFDGWSLLHFSDLLKERWDVKSLLAWDKETPTPRRSSFARQHDLLLFATKGKRKMKSKGHADVVRGQKEGGKKPVSLPEYCLEAALATSSLVLDPYASSGSLALAAQELGHSSISFADEPQKLSKNIQDLGGEAVASANLF